MIAGAVNTIPLPRILRLLGAGLAAWVAGGRLSGASDDAWITWRYAWNLVHGHGLRYNPGAEPVEGYSNLLWALWSAVGIGLGAPVERWCFASGLLLVAFTAWTAASLAHRLTRSRVAEVAALLLVAASPVLGANATTGLETPLLMALVILSLRLCAEGTPRALLAGAGAAGLAAVTHVEGPVFLLVPAVAAARAPRLPWRTWVALAALGLGPLAAQELLRLTYYGAWLPLTFEVKVAGSQQSFGLNGVRMLCYAATSNLLLVGLAVLGAWRFRAHAPLLLAPVLGAALFVLVANGDEIGGLRFLAGAMCAVATLAALGLGDIAGRGRIGTAAAVILGLGAAGWELSTMELRSDRREGPAMDNSGEDTLIAALTPPWGQAHRGSGLDVLLHRSRVVTDRSEPDWFVLYLMENLAPNGSFTFADVGAVGYALNGADLWDLRGLNWPATARLNSVGGADRETGMQSSRQAKALLDDFAHRAPDIAVLLCRGDRFVGRAELVIGTSGVFTSNYDFELQGAYFPVSQESVCIFRRRGAARPTADEVLRRKERVLREMPGAMWADP